jgi:hypothetical protein
MRLPFKRPLARFSRRFDLQRTSSLVPPGELYPQYREIEVSLQRVSKWFMPARYEFTQAEWIEQFRQAMHAAMRPFYSYPEFVDAFRTRHVTADEFRGSIAYPVDYSDMESRALAHVMTEAPTWMTLDESGEIKSPTGRKSKIINRIGGYRKW